MRLSFSLFVAALAATTTQTNAFVVHSPHKSTLSSWVRRRTPIPSTSRLNYSFNSNSGDKDKLKTTTPSSTSSSSSNKFDGYLEKVESAFERAQARLEKMHLELQKKEDKSQRALEAVQERMNNQESQLTDKLEYTNDQAAATVVVHNGATEAETSLQIAETASKRQIQLQEEMSLLIAQVEYEQERMAQSNQLLEESRDSKQELESQLTDLYAKLESTTQEWTLKYQQEQEARKASVEEAQCKVNVTQKEAEAAALESKRRIEALQQELTAKEQQKEEELLKMRQELKAQKDEWQQEVVQMGSQVTTLKEEAEQEKQALLDSHAARESELQTELTDLQVLLEHQQTKMVENQQEASRLVAERALLDTELTTLKNTYEQESAGWTLKYQHEQEARQVEVQQAQEEIKVQQEQAAANAAEYQLKLTELQATVSQKEEEKKAAVSAIQQEMDSRHAEWKHKVEEMGQELTGLKLEAHNEKLAVIDEYTARERVIQKEVETLQQGLEDEKSKFATVQETANDILQKRVALDAELAELKRRYESESEQWSARHQEEQEKRREEVKVAQEQLEQQQQDAVVEARGLLERLTEFQAALFKKEQQKQEAVLAIKDEMRSQEKELKERVSEMGSEATNIKLEAHKEKLAIIDTYDKREEALQDDMEALVQALEAEKLKARTNQQMTARIVAERVELDAELGQLQNEFRQESQTWTARHKAEQESRQRHVVESKQQLEEQQQAALVEANDLQDRITSLKGQLSTKEKQKREEILAIREETEGREKELKDKVSDLGLEVTNVKLAAHQERMAIVEEYKAREQSLESEIDHLRDLLGREKENLVVNQEMTGRIVAQRVDIDAQLGQLQREFDQERNNWTAQYTNQQEAHRRHVESSREDLEAMQQESLVEAKHAQDRITSLQQQLSNKERQKQDALLAIKDEMKSQEKVLKEKVHEMGTEVTNVKLDAHKEKMAVIAKYEAREDVLQNEISRLHNVIDGEKENLRINQGMTNNILAQRIEIDLELGLLRREYKLKGHRWSKQRQDEQKAHQLSAAKAKQELQDHQQQAMEHAAELHEHVLLLEKQLAAKERLKQAAIMSIKGDMKSQKEELILRANEVGRQVTDMKITANKEKMEATEHYKALEQKTREEIDQLYASLSAEREKLRANQEETERILAERVEIEALLSELKLAHELDSKNWHERYAAQQEARRSELAASADKLHQTQLMALEEAQTLQEGVASLRGQLASKGEEMQTEVKRINDEMKLQEEQLTGRISEVEVQASNDMKQAHEEKMAVIEEHKIRERQLMEEIASLRDLVDAEKQAMKVNKDLTNRILAQRTNIEAELGQLQRRYAQESTQWDASYHAELQARIAESEKAQQEMDELQKDAEKAAEEAEARKVSLLGQLSMKEREKQTAILAAKEEAKINMKKLQEMINEMGFEATNLKVQAHQEKMNMIKEHKAHQAKLQNEVDGVNKLLKAEKENMRINKDLTSRVVEKRTELEKELAVLQNQYQTDRQHWDAKYVSEHEKRLAEVAKAREQTALVEHNAERAAVDAENRRAALLNLLAYKEQQKDDTIRATQEEMRILERELKDVLGEMSEEFDRLQVTAHKDKLIVAEEFENREHELLSDLKELKKSSGEKSTTRRLPYVSNAVGGAGFGAQSVQMESKSRQQNNRPATPAVPGDESRVVKEIKQELGKELEEEMQAKELLRTNIKLFLQQGRINEALTYLN